MDIENSGHFHATAIFLWIFSQLQTFYVILPIVK